VAARTQYLLGGLLVIYVIALAVASGFGNRTLAVFGWILLAVIFAAVGVVRFVHR